MRIVGIRFGGLLLVVLAGCKTPEVSTKTTATPGKAGSGVKQIVEIEYVVPESQLLPAYYLHEIPAGMKYEIIETYKFSPWVSIEAKDPIKDGFIKDLSYRGIQCKADAIVIASCEAGRPIPKLRSREYKAVIYFVKLKN